MSRIPALLALALIASGATAGCIEFFVGWCTVDAIIVLPQDDIAGTVPTSPEFAREHADAWRNATVHLYLDVDGPGNASFPAVPTVEGPEDNRTLGYRLDVPPARDEYHQEVLKGLAYDRWYTWTIHLDVQSNDSKLQQVPLGPNDERAVAGELLVESGPLPFRPDAGDLHMRSEKATITQGVFHTVELPDTALHFLTKGECVN